MGNRMLRDCILLGMLFFAIILLSLSMTDRAYATTSTGIGIQIDGQVNALIGQTIGYKVSVYNLGTYWIKNATLTNTFPNGTSKTWQVPNLAPKGSPGDNFNVTGLLYVVNQADISPNAEAINPFVVDHAETVGYAEVQQVGLLVSAQDNFPTFYPPGIVGGYTVTIGTSQNDNSTSVAIPLLPLALEVLDASCGLGKFTMLRMIDRCRSYSGNFF